MRRNRALSLIVAIFLVCGSIFPAINSFIDAAEDIVMKDNCTDFNYISEQSGNVIVHDNDYFIIDPSKPHQNGELVYKVPFNAKVVFSVKSYGTDVFGWKVSGSSDGINFVERMVTDNRPSTADSNGWYNYDITLENANSTYVKIEYPYIENVWENGWATKIDKVNVIGEKTADEFVGIDELNDNSKVYACSGGVEIYGSEAFQKNIRYNAYVEYNFEPGNNLTVEGCIKDKGVNVSRFEVYASLDGHTFQKLAGTSSDSIRDNYWLDQKTTYENINATKVRIYFPPEYNNWFAMINRVTITKPKSATLLYEDNAENYDKLSNTSGNILVNQNDYFMQDETDQKADSFIEYEIKPNNDFIFNGLIADKGVGHNDFVLKGSNDGVTFEDIDFIKTTDIVNDYWAYNNYFSENVNYSKIRIYFPEDIKNWGALIDFVASYEKSATEDIADGSEKYFDITSNINNDKDDYDKFYKVTKKDIGKNYLAYSVNAGAPVEIIVREKSDIKLSVWQFMSTEDVFFADDANNVPSSTAKYNVELANKTFIKREEGYSYYKYQIANVSGTTLKVVYPDYNALGNNVLVDSVKVGESDVTKNYVYKSSGISSSFEQTENGKGAGYITYKISHGIDLQFGTINFDGVYNVNIEVSNDNVHYRAVNITQKVVKTDSRNWIYVNNYAKDIDAQFVRIWFSDCNEKYDWHFLLDYVKFGKNISDAYTDDDSSTDSSNELKGDYTPIDFENKLTSSESHKLFFGANDFVGNLDGFIASSGNLSANSDKLNPYNGFITPNKIPDTKPEQYGYITYKVPVGATVAIQFALAEKAAAHKTTFGIEQSIDNITYTHDNVNYQKLDLVDNYWQTYQASVVATAKYVRIRFPKTEVTASGWKSVLMKVEVTGGQKTDTEAFSGIDNFGVNYDLGNTYQVSHNLIYNAYTDPSAKIKGYISDSSKWVDGWKANASETWVAFKISKGQSVRFRGLNADKIYMYWLLEGSDNGTDWHTVNTNEVKLELSRNYWAPVVYTANDIKYEYLRIVFPYKNYNPDALWLTMLDYLEVANSEQEFDGKQPEPGVRFPEADYTPITHSQILKPSSSDKAFLGYNDFTENFDGYVANSGNIQLDTTSKVDFNGFVFPNKLPDVARERYGYVTYKVPASSIISVDYSVAGVIGDFEFGFGIEQSKDNVNFTPIKASHQHTNVIDNYWNSYKMTASVSDNYVRIRFPKIEIVENDSNGWCALLNKVEVNSSSSVSGMFTGVDDFNTNPSLNNTYEVSSNLFYNAYTDPESKSIGYYSDPNRWSAGWKASAAESWMAYKIKRGQSFRFNVLNAGKLNMYWLLETSDDGVNWRTVPTSSTYAYPVENYWQPITFTANNIQGEYVRIVFPFKPYNPEAYWQTMLNYVAGGNNEEELNAKTPLYEIILPEDLKPDFSPIYKNGVLDTNGDYTLFAGINDFTKDMTGLIAGTDNLKLDKNVNGDTTGYIFPSMVPSDDIEKYGYITYKVNPGANVAIYVALANMGMGYRTTFGIEESNDNINFKPVTTTFERIGDVNNYWLNARISGKATMKFIRIRFPSDISRTGNTTNAWTRKLYKVEISGEAKDDIFAGVNDFFTNPSLADVYETSHNLIYTKYTDPGDAVPGYFADNLSWTDDWKTMAKESYAVFKIKKGQSVRISTLSGDKAQMYWQLEGSDDGVNWYNLKAKIDFRGLIDEYWAHSFFTVNNIDYEYVRVVFPYKNYNKNAMWLTLLDSIAVADNEEGLNALRPLVNHSGLGPAFGDDEPLLIKNTMLNIYDTEDFNWIKTIAIIGTVIVAVSIIGGGVLIFIKLRKRGIRKNGESEKQ